MRKLLIKLVLFFAIVFVVDFAFGKVCDYLRDHTKGGFSGNVHYICNECNEDIIMMGSSRMKHHYVPQVFEDSLGLSCYNAGIDGNGIILSYGFMDIFLERYTPKLIIYDVTRFDMYDDDNIKYLGTLKAYYKKANVADIFLDVNPKEKWKMKSNLYRYNSDFLGLLGDNLYPTVSFDKGYLPSSKVMDYDPDMPVEEKQQVDSLKLLYVKKFVDKANLNNIKLVFVASPTYFGQSLPDYNDPLKELCKNNSIPFIDFFYDSIICENKRYWADATHMNDTGAKVFSGKLASLIKTKYNIWK